MIILNQINYSKLIKVAVLGGVLLVLSAFSVNAQVRLYVGNLSFQTTSEDLRELFSQAGTVVSAQVVEDKDTGRSRGFGFVVMANREEGEAAIQQFNGKELGGRHLNVNEARPRPVEDKNTRPVENKNMGGRTGCRYVLKQEPNQEKTESQETTAVSEDDEKEDSKTAEKIKIYVGNLSPQTTEQCLSEAFEQFGEVVSVKIGSGGGGRGVISAYVEMTADEAEEAIKTLHGTELNGQKIEVKKADDKKKENW